MKYNNFFEWWKAEGTHLQFTKCEKNLALAAWDACVNNFPEQGGVEQNPSANACSTGDEDGAEGGSKNASRDIYTELVAELGMTHTDIMELYAFMEKLPIINTSDKDVDVIVRKGNIIIT